MIKLGKKELISVLGKIQSEGKQFFQDSSEELEGHTFSEPYGRPYERTEFWDKLSSKLQKKSDSLVLKLIEIVPIIAETSHMTPYLTSTDQIDLGHAIKGLRSALQLCRYRYWDTDVIHDEGTVLGVQSAGQTDDEGVYPDDAALIFEDCFRRIAGIVQLVNPITIKHAGQAIEDRGQKSTTFKPDTAFIMMWMDADHSALEDVHNTVKRCFKEFGINAERADDIEHDGLITEEIIEKIRESEFLFADLTGARPSVYYEVGFAHAIRKRVLLYRKAKEKIHFDLAGYNCPEYSNLSDLEKKLKRRLSHIMGRKIVKE